MYAAYSVRRPKTAGWGARKWENVWLTYYAVSHLYDHDDTIDDDDDGI